MDTLPIAAFLVREAVERQFKPDRSDGPHRPAEAHRPVLQPRFELILAA